MFPFRASPRQADVLIVAGTLTTKMAGPLVRLWEQMPEPKWCVAMGDCTCSGGRYKRSYSTVEGIDRVMPVDVYIPGCPPRPEGLIYGMMKLQQLVKDRRGHWPERAIGPTVPRTSRRWTARSRRRLEARFGDRLLGPVRQRHDQTEMRIGAGDVDPGPDRPPRRAGPRASSSWPTWPASTPATDMQVVYHLWSETTPRLAAGHRRRPVARRPARPVGDVPVEGRRVDGARGLRHVRHHVRGQPRPAPDLHAARLPELPAAQGLLPARRRGPLARGWRPATWSRPTAPTNTPADRARPPDRRLRRRPR